ncbi:MAG: DsrE family protein [Chromatiales bacterium]|jgi:intracellular sulfur oxidation DsrE/DsrF family protein
MTRLITTLAILFVLLPITAGHALAGPAYGKQKVVYHINYDNPKQQAGALRNIQNHINAVGAENLDLKVVLHGDGLAMLVYPDSLKNTKLQHANANEQMQARIDGLKTQGVAFNVCANTLKGKVIDSESDLYNTSQDDIVPSGVAHLSYLQSQGYTYIKP